MPVCIDFKAGFAGYIARACWWGVGSACVASKLAGWTASMCPSARVFYRQDARELSGYVAADVGVVVLRIEWRMY